MNRFKIENNQLLVKTARHSDIVVISQCDQRQLLDLAHDLTALALVYRRVQARGSASVNLTRREWQVLEMRQRGRSVAEIAEWLHLSKRRVYQLTRAINAKIEALWQTRQAEAPKAPRRLYRSVNVLTIPISAISDVDEDGDEVAFELSDEGAGSEEIWRGVELHTALEDSTAYKLLTPEQQRLAKLLVRDPKPTHAECAQILGVSKQAVNQMVARMKKVLKDV